QLAVGAVGDDRATVAGAGKQLPGLADSAAVRPLEASGGGWRLVIHWLRELGSAQPAVEFRIQPRVLRPRASPSAGSHRQAKTRTLYASDTGRRGRPPHGGPAPRRHRAVVHAVFVRVL